MDTKPIIATTLTGLFIDDTPWKEAHKLWFAKYAEELGDPEIKKWAKREKYFEAVDIIMETIYPDLNKNQRTIQAREGYFNLVLDYLKNNCEDCINKSQVKYFKKLKKDFNIALISTTKDDALAEILKITKLDKIFDMVEGSKPNEKDDFLKVFRRFVKENAKPIIFVDAQVKNSRRDKKIINYLKSNNILYFVYTTEDYQLEK